MQTEVRSHPTPFRLTPPSLAHLVQAFSPVHRAVFRAPSLEKLLAPLDVRRFAKELMAMPGRRLSPD
jgi:hypothetical protein